MTVDELIELEIRTREAVALLEKEIAEAEMAPPPKLDGTEGRLSRQDSLQQHEIAMEGQRRRKLRLKQLHEALHRMDLGEFGRCATCGREIEYSRLDLQPHTLACKTCA